MTMPSPFDRLPPLGLAAGSDEFWARFPHGVEVYDANGKRIMRVAWCNPETGETIRYLENPFANTYLFGGSAFYHWLLLWLVRRFDIRVDGHLAQIHSFLPAPMFLKPKPALSQAQLDALVSEVEALQQVPS